MPTYEYACRDCGDVFEHKTRCQEFPSYKLECQKCGAMATRIFTAPTVIQTGYKPGDARYNRGKGQ